MRRVALLLLLAPAAAGCGSSSSAPTTTAAAVAPDPASSIGGHTIYHGGDWAVVVKGDKAAALHLVGDAWQPDRTGRVKVTFLGSNAAQPPTSQVAAELVAPAKLVESALWVDGVELLEKGGGLTATRGTIYGAATNLAKGKHVAVAYARTANAATAVARVFRVR